MFVPQDNLEKYLHLPSSRLHLIFDKYFNKYCGRDFIGKNKYFTDFFKHSNMANKGMFMSFA